MSHNTSRLGLTIPDGGDNESAWPGVSAEELTILDNAAIYLSGTLASRPAANTVAAGTLYYATDTVTFYISAANAWLLLNTTGNSQPVGALMQYAASSDPTDPDGSTRWLVCDGRAISRSTYTTLFGKISTTYGSGDGSTTFNIPDLRQRFPLGKAASGTGSTLGGTGGAIDHTHSTPAHTHPLSANGWAQIQGEWVGGKLAFNWNQSGTGALSGVWVESATGATAGTGNLDALSGGVSLAGSSDSGGASTSGTNNPPYLVVNHIIKVL